MLCSIFNIKLILSQYINMQSDSFLWEQSFICYDNFKSTCSIFAIKWQSALCLNTNRYRDHISTILYGPSQDWPDLFESLVHKKPNMLTFFLARLHEVHRAIVVTSVVRVYVYVCVRVTLSVKVF